MDDLHDYLEPINSAEILEDAGLTDGQIGKHILKYEDSFPELDGIEVVIIGVLEYRGGRITKNEENGPDLIRRQLYNLHYWHTDVTLADLGNIKRGSTLEDTYAAIKIVLTALFKMNKTVIILGGSHDITLAQYEAYRTLEKTVEITCVDSTIDLYTESPLKSENFLLEMLTGEPNLVKHYNHIAFQSYFVHPRMIETLDKLRFDCFRVGVVQENMEEMEPVIRSSDMVSFDISAIRNSDSPASRISPNGLTGSEACVLARYAGISSKLTSFGIFGYRPSLDRGGLSSMQIAQMIWYFIDGKNKKLQEALLENENDFFQFHLTFGEIESTFLQSKKTGRWWMQMPDKKFTPCSQRDYLTASKNEIPERWLRIQERDC